MKLIVSGATGLVGSEIIRQALRNSSVTEVVALARKPVAIDDSNASKLKNVVIRDYAEYPDEVKAQLAGADACIWTVAVTPFRSGGFDFAEVKRVCQDCTSAGFKAVYEAGPARPFRFLYFSAEGTPQDPSQRPYFLGDYQVMRCETENMVRKFQTQYEETKVCIAHPGVVTSSTTWTRTVLGSIFGVVNLFTRAFPNVSQSELAAAVLDQAIDGFDKETLSNNDLVRIGQSVLQKK
ncbi:uncharacterized protein N7484_003945 [Penicillium longicatenatum]|uniref:uncharacterized protein n=1 Tax=Penicillium longicatenatum TaxID=1561947 RepID=UPI0025484D8E|nr:uncharacterized protein N7484_003945 [Penicillium longicatenatum]KAJ5650222.1 hypothetical protein N7484_003945 [Penicillium longicatenatum]